MNEGIPINISGHKAIIRHISVSNNPNILDVYIKLENRLYGKEEFGVCVEAQSNKFMKAEGIDREGFIRLIEYEARDQLEVFKQEEIETERSGKARKAAEDTVKLLREAFNICSSCKGLGLIRVWYAQDESHMEKCKTCNGKGTK